MKNIFILLIAFCVIGVGIGAQTKIDPGVQINWTKNINNQIHGVTNGTAAQDAATYSQLEVLINRFLFGSVTVGPMWCNNYQTDGTNDSVQVNQAIDYVGALGGGVVELTGTITVDPSTPIAMDQTNVVLRSNHRSTIVVASGSAGPAVSVTGFSNQINDLAINGNRVAYESGSYGIACTGGNRLLMYNVGIYHTGDAGIFVATGGSTDYLIHDIDILECYGNGATLSGDDGSISHSLFENNSGTQITLYGSDWSITDNHLWAYGANENHLMYMNGSTSSRVNGNSFDGPYWASLVVDTGCQLNAIVGNIFFGARVSGTQPIILKGYGSNTVIGNVFYPADNITNAIYIDTGSDANIIIGNQLHAEAISDSGAATLKSAGGTALNI